VANKASISVDRASRAQRDEARTEAKRVMASGECMRIKVQTLRENGISWSAIAERFGKTEHALRNLLRLPKTGQKKV